MSLCLRSVFTTFHFNTNNYSFIVELVPRYSDVVATMLKLQFIDIIEFIILLDCILAWLHGADCTQ